MSFLNLYKVQDSTERPYLSRFAPRDENIAELKKRAVCDILVVGGGIHGACFAQLSALTGLRTVLLERADYASGTSSRSSKMAHGGLRYLEMLDFKQVLEGVKAREDLFEIAPHLVTPERFLIPVQTREKFFRWKLGLGLIIYDLFVRDRKRKHEWCAADSLSQEIRKLFGANLQGGFLYSDGLMNDTRLVIERIVAARQEGALCLNYTSVDSLHAKDSGEVIVGWTEKLSGEKGEIKTGIVINCAGPWVPFVGRVKPAPVRADIRYSRGTHLLFNKRWSGPALFLPIEDRHRYYFVWPHFSGTMVGTTERELDDLPLDPIPAKDEVEELLNRLAKDLPRSGLDRSTLHYCFAGVRTLYAKRGAGRTGSISRRHLWSYSAGVLSLIGGKYTTASSTAQEGLKIAFKLSGILNKPASLTGRKLPGGALLEERTREFRAAAEKRGLPEEVIGRTISRYGGRARFFLESDELLKITAGTMLSGEIEMALAVEQAETLEDLMRRRLDLEYMPDNGLGALAEITALFKARRPNRKAEDEEREYRARIESVRALMHK